MRVPDKGDMQGARAGCRLSATTPTRIARVICVFVSDWRALVTCHHRYRARRDATMCR